MPKKTIKIEYGLSEWAIVLIELDNLEIAKVNRSVRANSIRDTHRQKIIDLITSDPNASRKTVSIQLPGTYCYVLKKDRDWLHQQFPLRRKSSLKAERHIRVDRTKLDKALAIEVRHLINRLMSSSSKPVRISKHALLKRIGHLNKYRANPVAFPETRSLLEKFTESQHNFINRKITWAIGEILNSGQTISINTLRRRVNIQPSKLREHSEFVIKVAQDYGATINMQSFFANTHT
jgi:hypothetical protein